MYEFTLLLRQDAKLLFTNVMWIFYNLLFPFLLTWILGTLCHSMYGESITSYDYYSIAFLIYSGLNAATIAANSFMEERIKGGNMRVLYAPIPHEWLYLSKIIASSVFTFVCHVMVGIALVLIFHVNIGSHGSLLVLLLAIVEVFSCIVGVLCCLLLKSESMANQIISVVINLSAVLGGVFFSLERFGSLFSMITWISPMKWLMNACFTCIYDQRTTGISLLIIVFSCFSLLLLWYCKHCFVEEDCLCSSY